MAYEYYGYGTMDHTVNETGESLFGDSATEPIFIKPLLGKWIHICNVVTFHFDSEGEYASAYGDLTEQVFLDGTLKSECKFIIINHHLSNFK